jgi:hypothetical protein
MIIERIRSHILEGTVIPKAKTRAEYRMKGWGQSRGEIALVYTIPNRKHPDHPHQKGITESEFRQAYGELQRSGKLTRAWFNNHFSKCAKERPCNFTTIGGIFQLLGEANYSGQGLYMASEYRR